MVQLEREAKGGEVNGEITYKSTSNIKIIFILYKAYLIYYSYLTRFGKRSGPCFLNVIPLRFQFISKPFCKYCFPVVIHIALVLALYGVNS